jgi:hypothetical protein
MVAISEFPPRVTQTRPQITRPETYCPWGGRPTPQEQHAVPPTTAEQEPLVDRVAKLPVPAQRAFESMTGILGPEPKSKELIYDFIAKVEERYTEPDNSPNASDDFLTPDEKTSLAEVTHRLHTTISGRMKLNHTATRLYQLEDGQETEIANSLGEEFRLLLEKMLGKQQTSKHDSLNKIGNRYFFSVVDRLR